MKITLNEHAARLCLYATIWQVAEAGLYRAIKVIHVSPDIFECVNWLEVDSRLICRIVRNDALPPLTCYALTGQSCAVA